MAAAGLDFDGGAFLAGLAKATQAIKIKSTADLLRVAIDTQNRARSACPVDTGRLRSSITHKVGRDKTGPFVEVGTNVKYAMFVEFGTTRQRAQPYLRPALLDALRAWR